MGGMMALFSRTERRISRLLVVEDEPLVAFDNEYVLDAAGYTVVATVDRGDAAIACLASEEIHAVVLDVSLAGGVSGLDVARAAAQRQVPVLFVTGNCPVEARDLALGCLSKPYRPAGLTGALESIDRLLQGLSPEPIPQGLTLFRDAPERSPTRSGQ